MRLGVQVEALSFGFRTLNIVFMLTGASGIGFGVFILSGESLLTILDSEEFTIVGTLMFGTGLVMLIVSWVCGCRDDAGPRAVLLWYAGFCTVAILCQLFVVLLMLMGRGKIEHGLHQTVDQIVLQYRGNSSEDALMDRIQKYEACCGGAGPKDWQENLHLLSLNRSTDVLPCSCFNSSRPAGDSPWCDGTGNIYQEGCQQKVSDWLRENTLTVIGMQLVVLILEVMQLAVAAALHRALSRIKSCDGEQNFDFTDADDAPTGPAHPEYHHDDLDYDNPAYLSYHHDDQNS